MMLSLLTAALATLSVQSSHPTKLPTTATTKIPSLKPNSKSPTIIPSSKPQTAYPSKSTTKPSLHPSKYNSPSNIPNFRTVIPSKSSNSPSISSTISPSSLPSSSSGFLIYQLNNYNPYIYGTPHVLVYEGSRIAIVVSDGVQADFNPDITDKNSNAAMQLIVQNVQDMLTVYDAMMGMVPAPVGNPQIHNKVPYEIGYIPAGGLASAGVAGTATGPAFIGDMYKRALQGESNINHVFFYETFRNYIFPNIFTKVLEYSLSGPLDYGWVDQGFIDVTGCLVSDTIKPPVTFNYYGYDRIGFMNMMEANLITYVSNSSYNWTNTFMRDILPWSPPGQKWSLDNLYAGIIVNLYKYEGGFQFISGFFHALPGLVPRAPATMQDNQAARDNFYLAASIGAQKNLYNFFARDLRWTISRSATSYLQTTYPNIYSTPGHEVTKAPSLSPTTLSPASSGPRIFLTAKSYSMNMGGIAGADAICTTEAGRSAKALLTDVAGCSGSPCRRATAPQIGWPLLPNTAYYNADYSAVVAVTDSHGLLPATLTSAVTVNGCINEATGMKSDWSTPVGYTCNDWTTTSTSTNVAVGWLCPNALSTSDLLQGGSFDCSHTIKFLCVAVTA